MKVSNRFHTYFYPQVLESFGTESVLTMASAEANRLETFKCAAAGRYRLPAEWFYKDIKVRYLKVRIALKNLDNFIKAVRSCEPLHYTVNPVVNVSDLQQSPGPASDEEERTFTLERGGNEHCYRYAGPRVLNDRGKLNEEAKERYEQFIFTPSKGQCDIGVLRWNTELADTLGGGVVPLAELKKYSG